MGDIDLLKKVLRDKMMLGLLVGAFVSALINNFLVDFLWLIAFLYLYVALLARVRPYYISGPKLCEWHLGMALTWYSLKFLVLLTAILIPSGLYFYHSGLIPNLLDTIGADGNVAQVDLKSLMAKLTPIMLGILAIFYALSFSGIAVVLLQGKAARSVRRSFLVFFRDFPIVALWTLFILAPMLIHDPLGNIPSMTELMSGKIPQEHFSLWPAINALVTTIAVILAPIHLADRYRKRIGPQVPAPPPLPKGDQS